MFKRSTLCQAMLLALVLPGAALAEIEASGYLKNETAVFTKEGQVTGEATSTYDEEGHDKGELLKFENSARIFLNGYFGEESSWHGDLNIIYDSEGVNDDYKGHKIYTQHDWLKELYIDTNTLGWDLRLGKQQVVWGTADGIKLLDIINPTDYRELNQNAMEDSRIPIWMINAERNVGENGNIQFIVSQAEENKIPGLNDEGDAGHPFIMKGVDSITGQVNGFLNIVPNLTGVATSFTIGAVSDMFGTIDFTGDGMTDGLVPFSNMSVDAFASNAWAMDASGVLVPTGPVSTTTDTVSNFAGFAGNGFVLLNAIAQQSLPTLLGDVTPNDYANSGETNLMHESGESWTVADLATTTTTVTWDVTNPVSSFEYMPNASFATFNNDAGNLWLGETLGSTEGLHGPTQSEYVRDYPDESEVNFGFRYKNSTDAGLNISLNYFYGYSANPSVSLSSHDSITGELLQHELRQPDIWRALDANGLPTGAVLVGEPTVEDLQTYAPAIPNYGDDNVNVIANDEVRDFYDGTINVAYNAAGEYYGAFNPTTGELLDGTHSRGGIVTRFTETVERANNVGLSFDYALDTGFAPLVLRGEFLYTKDEMQPVVDKRLLGIGYLPGGLVSEEHDMFKYVLGLDVNVLTNMMVSAQFIQFRNLDFIDEERTCFTQSGAVFDCSRYTADPAVLHLDNDLQKGYETKEFYSLFFSKPFGDAQEHRWNNITIYEEGGGHWNRFDVEYSFTDNLIGSTEWNNYGGDENTNFGQLDKSSNLQLGVKWLFD